MSNNQSARQMSREASVLLRRMRMANGYLEYNFGAVHGDSTWQLMNSKNDYSRPVAQFEIGIVNYCVEQQWLCVDPDGNLRLARSERNSKLQPGNISNVTAHNRNFCKRNIEIEPGVKASVNFNQAESPLCWLFHRKDSRGRPLLSAEQFEAGERLRCDYETALLGQRVTSIWDPDVHVSKSRKQSNTSGFLAGGQKVLDARRRFHQATVAVGPELSSILIEVCCLSNGFESAERRLNWPRRSSKLVLRIALERLALHYCLIASNRPVSQSRQCKTWSLKDYKPRLFS